MLVEVKFFLQTPLIIADALHLDGLLYAVHPDAKEIFRVNWDIKNKELQQLPLPIKKAVLGEKWVYAASSIDLPECAHPFAGKYSKRKSGADVFNLQKNVMINGGVWKNWINKIQGYVTPFISFLAECYDKPALEELCDRVTGIGKLRGIGYGAVKDIEVKKKTGEWRDTLVKDDIAMRNLPKGFCSETYRLDQVNINPPYWGMNYRRELGVQPGTPAKLREEVCLC